MPKDDVGGRFSWEDSEKIRKTRERLLKGYCYIKNNLEL